MSRGRAIGLLALALIAALFVGERLTGPPSAVSPPLSASPASTPPPRAPAENAEAPAKAATPSLANASSAPLASPAPPPEAGTESAPPAGRATTWLVLRVASTGADLVAVVHKDALPYAAQRRGPVRFRLIEAEGTTTEGFCDWPRLCDCPAPTDHTRGCIRRHHSASVRLRLPRLQGPSRVVIERRSPEGWTQLANFEVKA